MKLRNKAVKSASSPASCSSLRDLVAAMAERPSIDNAKALAKGLKAAGRIKIEIGAVMNCSPRTVENLLR